MITLYKVFNPYTGLYTDVSSLEELKIELGRIAWESYMQMTNNLPFAVVTLNDDGSQIWRSATGDVVLDLNEQRKKTSDQVKIPLTILGNENE